MNEESIFAAALNCQSPAERAAFLDEACGGDAALRGQIEDLLRASSDAGSFLEHPPAEFTPTIEVAADGTNPATHPLSQEILPALEPCNSPGRLGQLGVYEIIEVVGHGGMATVMRAFDTKLSRVVAVKIMAAELAANPQAVRRFLREASTAAAVVHDHVVTIHAIDDTHRPPFLVMEFIEGQTLQQKIDRTGALELKHILRIGAQMAEGLAAAHKKGLIHRDVKPANILLENGVERVKITDFGLARAGDDLEMTREGIIAGTPQYMSPEQAKGEVIDTRSDLFSLGSVLYTMCTGRPAFRADSTMGVLRRVCEDTPRPIREISPELPPWLEAIVEKLLAKLPNERFQTASEVAELLGQHLAHIQNPTVVPQPALVTPPQKQPLEAPRKKVTARQWQALAVMLITVAVGLLAWFGPTLLLNARNLSLVTVELDDDQAELVLMGKQDAVRARDGEQLYVRPGEYRLAVVTPAGKELAHFHSSHRTGLGTHYHSGERVTPRIALSRGDRLRLAASFKAAETAQFDDLALGTWVPLFNGRDLSGWKTHPERPAPWQVLQGELVAPRSHGYLFTERGDYSDFQMRVQVKVGTNADSGICVRAPFAFGDTGYVVAYEVAIIGGARAAHPYKTGAVMALVQQHREYIRVGEWFDLEIQMVGQRMTIKVNGQTTVNETLKPVTEPERARPQGHIALQATPGSDVRFRKVEIRELKPFTPLFDGKSLAGWKTHPNQPGGWKVEEGLLVGSGAVSHLFSEREFADFHLRAEAMINERGDSGIFFRSEYGLKGFRTHSRVYEPLGYEAQLIHDFAGITNTGSVFSPVPRSKSEQTVAGIVTQPNEWFDLEIVARGNRIQTFVNGQPRADFIDPDRRFTRGHLALQVYNPATVVKFRKIEIRELTGSDTESVAPALISPEQLAAAKTFPGWSVSWSPDGKQVVRSIRSPSSVRIEITDIESGESRVLIESGIDPVWSPIPGGPIAYFMSPERGLASDEVWLIEVDGSNARRFASGGYPAWSSDGKRLYFRMLTDSSGFMLVSQELDDPEGTPKMLSKIATPYPATHASGSLFAHAAKNETLSVVDPGTQDIIAQVTGLQWAGVVMSWHPSGRYLGYGGYADGRGAWLLDIETNTTQLLAAGSYTCPRWSPDGTQLALDDRANNRFLLLDAAQLKLAPPLTKPGLPTAAAPAVAPFSAEQATAWQKVWSAKLGVPIEHENSLGMKLRLIPPGEFMMGTTAVQNQRLQESARAKKNPVWVLDELALESPQRLAKIPEPYYIGQYEVTVADFRKFVADAEYVTDGKRSQNGGYGFFEGKYLRRPEHQWDSPGEWELAENQPVVQISWEDAQAFCKWLSKKEGVTYALPTDAQWEFAARAGTTRLFGTSELDVNLDKYAYTMQTSSLATRYQPKAVGLKRPNAFGLFDMQGNAWELGQEWHKPGGTRRVTRGGGWNMENHRVHTASRGGAEAGMAWDSATGFRVVITGDLAALRPKR